jgi:SGNH domain (fused to AT3 domains)
VGQYEPQLAKQLAAAGKGLISFNHEQCPFVSSELWFGAVPECSVINELRWQEILQFKDKKTFFITANIEQFKFPKRRIMSEIAPGYRSSFNITESDLLNPALAWQSYFDNIEKLLALGHRVVLVRSLPVPSQEYEGQVMRQVYRGEKAGAFTPHVAGPQAARIRAMDRQLYPPMSHPRLTVVDPVQFMCAQEDGEDVCFDIMRAGPLFNGAVHLSEYGAEVVLRGMFQQIKP